MSELWLAQQVDRPSTEILVIGLLAPRSVCHQACGPVLDNPIVPGLPSLACLAGFCVGGWYTVETVSGVFRARFLVASATVAVASGAAAAAATGAGAPLVIVTVALFLTQF